MAEGVVNVSVPLGPPGVVVVVVTIDLSNAFALALSTTCVCPVTSARAIPVAPVEAWRTNVPAVMVVLAAKCTLGFPYLDFKVFPTTALSRTELVARFKAFRASGSE